MWNRIRKKETDCAAAADITQHSLSSKAKPQANASNLDSKFPPGTNMDFSQHLTLDRLVSVLHSTRRSLGRDYNNKTSEYDKDHIKVLHHSSKRKQDSGSCAEKCACET